MPSTGRPRGNSLFILAIFVAMLAGGLLGALLGRELPLLALVGDLFLAGLKMMIVPLVGSSMIVGVASLGDVRRLGRLGGLTLVYYLSTTLLAAALGLLLVNLIHPGAGVDATSAALEGASGTRCCHRRTVGRWRVRSGGRGWRCCGGAGMG